MRHGNTINHLGRTTAHRKALLMNLANSLILHKRIETTLAKARELRKFVEPLLTRSKSDTTHNRRIAFSYLQNKEVVKELFGAVSDKVSTREGGYTRIIKLGARLGDNAEMVMMELVDFNETLLTAAEEASKAKTRRSRRGGKAAGSAAVAASAPVAEVVAAEEAPAVEAVAEVVAEEEAPAVEAVAETEAPEAAADEAPASEEGEENKPEA